MMVRVFIPAVLILTPFWMIPMSLYLHLSTTLPILIPFVFFSHALNKVWRRHMLRKHGLDPGLVDYVARQRDAHVHDAYIAEVRTAIGPAEQPGRLSASSAAQVAEFVERLRPAGQPVGRGAQLVAVALGRHRRTRHRSAVGRGHQLRCGGDHFVVLPDTGLQLRGERPDGRASGAHATAATRLAARSIDTTSVAVAAMVVAV